MEFQKYLEKTRKANGEKYLPKTIALYMRYYEKYEKDFLERKDNVDALIDFMNDIVKKSRNPPVSATFRLYLMFIGLDEEDPRLKTLKRAKRNASAINSLRILGQKSIPHKDMELLINSVEPEWKLIIKVLYDTGARENEFLNMRWKDVVVNKDPNSRIGAEIRILGKGGKYRTVFIKKDTLVLLMDKRVEAESEKDRIFIFRMENGKLYKRQEKALYDGFVKRTKKILGKNFSPHGIRHSTAQHLCDGGAEIMGVSTFLGHSNLSVTQVYAKGSKAIAKNMFEKSLGDP